jgi:hypothetical protein
MSHKDLYKRFSQGGGALLLTLLAGAAACAQSVPPTTAVTVPTVVTASYQVDQQSAAQTATSNTVNVLVENGAGVALSPVLKTITMTSTSPSIYPMSIQNTGSITDTYTFNLLHTFGWTAKIIADNAGTGVWQSSDTTQITTTTSLAPGATESFFIVMTPPTSFPNCTGEALLVAHSSAVSTMYAQALTIGYLHER